jgi:cell division protein FtsQ
MTYSSHRPNRPPAARRTTRRRLNTTAQVAISAPSSLKIIWVAHRAKILASCLCVMLFAVLYFFFETDNFYVFSFNVAGAQFLTTAEIEKATGLKGYNIFFIDSRAAERAIGKLPEVKSVHVTTRLPNQVIVEIQERAPQVVWQRGNETYWVDGEGIFTKARTNLTQLPSVRDLDQGEAKPG